MRQLLQFDWPGNIRQLRNVLRTVAALCDSGVIDIDDLPDEISTRLRRDYALRAGPCSATARNAIRCAKPNASR